MRENLVDYFQRVTEAKSVRAIALAIGADPSTLNRQLVGATSLTVETVVTICRQYNLDFAESFVAAGFITSDEADRLGAQIGLSVFTDLELAHEIVRRLEAGEASEALTGDLPEPTATITPLGVRGQVEDDLLAAADERTGDDETDEGHFGA